ncbi:MAG: hypothetical protein WC974_09765 [Thermoplasmata archaeon]
MKINLISNANKALSLFWLVAISLSIIGIAFAAAPNPGHDVTAVSGGAVQGDIFYGSAVDTLLALPKNITATRYLSNTGATNNPAWAQIDLTNGVTGLLPDGNISSAATWNAKLTNPMTTLGDIIYGGASGVATRLGGAAGFLKSTGAAAPAWSAVSLTADVSGILPTANGGTGIAFFTAAGPTAARIFTFPDAAATVLTSNAAVTVAQGGTALTAAVGDAVLVGDSTSAYTARTLPASCAGTTAKLLYDSTTNLFSCGTDQTAAGGTPQPYYPNRQWCYLRPLGTTATVFTSVGCAAFVVTGTAAASAQTNSYYIQHTAAATINTLGGISQTLIQTQGRYRPKLTALIRTDSVITSRRIWVGLHSVANSTTASMQGSDLTGAQTDRYVGVRYSTSAGDTQWQCGSGDGTTGSVITTGVTVAASTAYLITVDWSVNGTLTCTVNGTSVNKTTNLDATQTANLGLHAALTTLTAATRIHQTAFVHLETN